MNHSQALRLALDALGKFSIGYHVDAVELNDLIATLEAALEQPGQDVPETNCGNNRALDDIEALLAAEREACAQILDRNVAVCGNNTPMRDVLAGNAMAIRARSAL